MPRKLVILLVACLCSCGTPSQRFDAAATSFGFSGTTLSTPLFKHKIYRNFRLELNSNPKRIHIYLDGDGTPWEQEQWLADDATARDPLILRLMQVDPTPAILVGRPCYYGFSHESNCDPKYWTSHRYSQAIVDSLVQTLQKIATGLPASELVLIGYSGGGTLAMLIAPHIKKLHSVITLAANLDTRSWSLLHGYPPLAESLNPIDLSPLKQSIKQYHFVGENDQNVPASMVQPFANKQHAYFRSIKDLNHNGCWECIWASLLTEIEP